MRIASSPRSTCYLVFAVVATIGLWCSDHPRPSQPNPPLDVSPSREIEVEPSSSGVEHELRPPPADPFYASLFVRDATWDLPCRIGDTATGTQRCHVDSVTVTATETRAQIACWYVREHELRARDPAINTYVMTARGLYLDDTRGEPLYTPKPVPKALPPRWGLDEPRGGEAMHAEVMVHHHGAWCRGFEVQTMDYSFGRSECISRRGIVGSSYHREGIPQICGDTP